jgi:hypothetical protein
MRLGFKRLGSRKIDEYKLKQQGKQRVERQVVR